MKTTALLFAVLFAMQANAKNIVLWGDKATPAPQQTVRAQSDKQRHIKQQKPVTVHCRPTLADDCKEQAPR